MSSNPSFVPGYAEESISHRVLVVAGVFIVLEIAFVVARFAVRISYKSPFGIDDYLTVPALLFCLGMCIILIIEVHIAGIGRHLDVLAATDPEAVLIWSKCGYAIEQIYCAAVAFPKLSILASYLRIFVSKPYRIATYVVAGIVSATAIAGIITSFASCRPFSARWDPDLFLTNCINAARYWQGISVPNVATDLVMLVLPLPVVWDLNVSKSQKLGLSLVFLMGSMGIIAAIVRLVMTLRITALSDATWETATIATWSLVETGCYLIASCLPVLRPVFLRLSRGIKMAVKGTDPESQASMGQEPARAFPKHKKGFITLEMGSWPEAKSVHDKPSSDIHPALRGDHEHTATS